MLTQLTLQHNTERVLRDPVIPLTRVTLLTGPNGSGKSTVADAIKELIINPFNREWTRKNAPILIEGHAKAVLCWSFERDNPRTVNVETLTGDAYGFALLSRFYSHGQSNHERLQAAFAGTAFSAMVLDEPESALDLDGLLMLRENLLATDKQVILATHSPLLLTLLGMEGVSAQVFGPDPDYPQRVLQVYRDAVGAGIFAKPQPRLPMENDTKKAPGARKKAKRPFER